MNALPRLTVRRLMALVAALALLLAAAGRLGTAAVLAQHHAAAEQRYRAQLAGNLANAAAFPGTPFGALNARWADATRDQLAFHAHWKRAYLRSLARFSAPLPEGSQDHPPRRPFAPVPEGLTPPPG